jgi:Immunoglobulin I-set domain
MCCIRGQFNVGGRIALKLYAFFLFAASSPNFNKRPADQKIVEGQSVTLTCSVEGAPQPKVTWRRGSPSQPVAGGDRIIIHSNGNLEIKVSIVDFISPSFK